MNKSLKNNDIQKKYVLTPEQLKRFRHWLVKRGCFPSYQKAIRGTDSHIKCRAVFLEIAPWVDDFEFEGIMDISETYTVYDYEQPNDICDLPIDSLIEPNHICDKVSDTAQLESNRICKKPRGKQKAQPMRSLLVKLPPDTIERLKALDGTTSHHIRAAIDAYLSKMLLLR